MAQIRSISVCCMLSDKYFMIAAMILSNNEKRRTNKSWPKEKRFNGKILFNNLKDPLLYLFKRKQFSYYFSFVIKATNPPSTN